MSGIYLHIPFCGSKCLYCCFYSRPLKKHFAQNYAEALIGELSLREAEILPDCDTIYIGGGTPSRLDDESLGKLLSAIFARLPLGASQLKEITMEVNPEDVTAERAGRWAQMGINRVSMGVQSFNDSTLRAIGRRHDSDKARHAYYILRRTFANISLDLICGLPEERGQWEHSVEEILKLSPEHISVYILETDNDSALASLHRKGRILLPDEEEVQIRFSRLIEALRGAGYTQYEISNFARSGFESRHNSSYWYGSPYLGLGPSAASFDGKNIRRTNDADLEYYLSSDGNCKFTVETLDKEQLRLEYLLTRIRTQKGIDIAEFRQRFGEKALQVLTARSERFIQSEDMLLDKNALRLSHKGIFIEDYILSCLV